MKRKSFMNRAVLFFSMLAILGGVFLSGCTPRYGCYYGISDQPETIDHHADVSIQPIASDPECALTAE